MFLKRKWNIFSYLKIKSATFSIEYFCGLRKLVLLKISLKEDTAPSRALIYQKKNCCMLIIDFIATCTFFKKFHLKTAASSSDSFEKFHIALKLPKECKAATCSISENSFSSRTHPAASRQSWIKLFHSRLSGPFQIAFLDASPGEWLGYEEMCMQKPWISKARDAENGPSTALSDN